MTNTIHLFQNVSRFLKMTKKLIDEKNKVLKKKKNNYTEIWFHKMKRWQRRLNEGGKSVDTADTLSLLGQKKIYERRAKPRVCGWIDGLMGWDGTRYQTCPCIFLIIYVFKNCHQLPYAPQNLMSSWGVGVMNFENTAGRWLFRFLVRNLSLAAWKRRSSPTNCRQPVCSSRLSSSLPNGCLQPLSNAPTWCFERLCERKWALLFIV